MLPRALLLLCLAARLQLPAAVDEALSGFPFSGFDVVLVAGQDNALGAAETPADEATRRADSTAGLPVFGHLFGQRNGGRTDDTASPLTPLHEEYVKTPATGDAYKGNTFAVAFVKKYIEAGYLKPGRAVVVVNAGWSGSSFSYHHETWFPFPSKQTTLVQCWAPDAACNPAVAKVSFAASESVGEGITMSLFTHATWRTDHALSLDPATGRPSPGRAFGAPHPANKLAAVLWHQGEADACCGYDVKRWAACLDALVAAWRRRFGASTPFVAGTFTSPPPDAATQQLFRHRFPAHSAAQLSRSTHGVHSKKGPQEYTDFLRFNFGQGLYGPTPAPDGIEAGQTKPLLPEPTGFYHLLINATMPVLSSSFRLGLADSAYEDKGGLLVPSIAAVDPANPIHFSVEGNQQMGRRYFTAFARIVGPP